MARRISLATLISEIIPTTRDRRPPAADPTPALAAIDTAITQVCACGCGTPITDESPSAYYASAGCQSKWLSRDATDPGDVYRRPDAGLYPATSSARWRPDMVNGDDMTAIVAGTMEAWMCPTPDRAAQYREMGFTASAGRHPDGVRYVMRLHNGYRYVERIIRLATETIPLAELGATIWRALERQMTVPDYIVPSYAIETPALRYWQAPPATGPLGPPMRWNPPLLVETRFYTRPMDPGRAVAAILYDDGTKIEFGCDDDHGTLGWIDHWRWIMNNAGTPAVQATMIVELYGRFPTMTLATGGRH